MAEILQLGFKSRSEHIIQNAGDYLNRAAMLVIALAIAILFLNLAQNSSINLSSNDAPFFADVAFAYSAADVVAHPQNFLNKQVTIYTFEERKTQNFQPIANYELTIEDKSGKPLHLLAYYPEFYCSYCDVTGVIREFGTTCACQGKIWYPLNGSKVWDDRFYEIVPKEKCESGDFVSLTVNTLLGTQCLENSDRTAYYLNVTDVVSKD